MNPLLGWCWWLLLPHFRIYWGISVMFASMLFTCLLFISLLCKFHVTSKSIISNTFYVCQVLFVSIFVTSKIVLSNCGFPLAIDCFIAVGSPVSTPLPYYSLYRSCAVISCVSAFWAMPSNTKLQAEQAWQASSPEALWFRVKAHGLLGAMAVRDPGVTEAGEQLQLAGVVGEASRDRAAVFPLFCFPFCSS